MTVLTDVLLGATARSRAKCWERFRNGIQAMRAGSVQCACDT
jgi:hypothetical protein